MGGTAWLVYAALLGTVALLTVFAMPMVIALLVVAALVAVVRQRAGPDQDHRAAHRPLTCGLHRQHRPRRLFVAALPDDMDGQATLVEPAHGRRDRQPDQRSGPHFHGHGLRRPGPGRA
jgi:hypothetical protein